MKCKRAGHAPARRWDARDRDRDSIIVDLVIRFRNLVKTHRYTPPETAVVHTTGLRRRVSVDTALIAT